MTESAQVVLQKTLSQLVAQKARTEREIKAVEAALVSIGVKSPKLAARRRRKPMNAAERKSVSKRMKAYWAKKRAQKAS
jgi:hypothetical protein